MLLRESTNGAIFAIKYDINASAPPIPTAWDALPLKVPINIDIMPKEIPIKNKLKHIAINPSFGMLWEKAIPKIKY